MITLQVADIVAGEVLPANVAQMARVSITYPAECEPSRGASARYVLRHRTTLSHVAWEEVDARADALPAR